MVLFSSLVQTSESFPTLLVLVRVLVGVVMGDWTEDLVLGELEGELYGAEDGKNTGSMVVEDPGEVEIDARLDSVLIAHSSTFPPTTSTFDATLSLDLTVSMPPTIDFLVLRDLVA